MEAGIINWLVYYILSFFILLTIIAFSKWREYSREKKLRNLVSWSALGDYCPALGRYSYVQELLFSVLNTQNAVDKKYRITEETERQYIIEIIETYQQDLMRLYFKGYLKLIKSKYSVNGEDYFLIALCSFLKDHQCDDKFLGHNMHKERTSYKEFGSWGGTLFDATYILTDFAIVYHKLYYITYMFCKNSKISNPDGYRYNNDRHIKEILDTKQLKVSRY